MHHSIIIHAIITICLLFLSNAERIFCPPDHFVKNANRSVRGYRTALMFEIHGRLYVSKSDLPLYWAEYHNGGAISRNIYNHVGILGIDKVYISVFYNESLYPTPPTVEDIYPPDKYCVSDWNNLGVIGWRPTPFGGPVENWPLNAKGKPSLDKNLYKSIRGSNIIYEGKTHCVQFCISDFVYRNQESYGLRVSSRCRRVFGASELEYQHSRLQVVQKRVSSINIADIGTDAHHRYYQ